MGLFSRLFTKARNQSLFAFFIPSNAPSTAARNLIKAYALPWVNACVRAIAADVSTIELKLQRKTGDEWEDVKSHEAIDILGSVNPRTTSDDLFFGTQAFMDLSGDSFWYVAYSNGSGTTKSQPKELWLMDPTRMAILRGGPDGIKGYEYTNEQGKKVELKPWEVIHFHDFNPEDLMRGMGIVKPAAVPIDIDTYASEHNRNFFFNSAIPGMTLETDQKLSDEQFERLEQKWLDKFQGIKNAHLPAVLEGGLKVNKITQTAQEMDYTEGKKLVRDEILAVFHTPKSILGITEDVNRANAEASEYVFAKRVIAPRMRFIATRLTEFYLPLWGLNPAEWRIVLAKDPVPENVELKAKVNQMYVAAGVLTRNEVRESEGFEAVTGGEVLLVPNNYVPLTHAVKPPEPMPAPGAPTNQPPPKKDFKGEYSSTDERERYFTTTINKGATEFESVYRTIQKDTNHKLRKHKAFTKDDNPNAVPAQEAELSKLLFENWELVSLLFLGALERVVPPVLLHAARQTINRIDAAARLDDVNPRITAWLHDHNLASATQVSDGIKGEMTEILSNGVKEGKSVREIAKDLGKFFDEESQWRALRIARTEVMTTYAYGSVEAARQLNLNEKRWVTSSVETNETCVMNASAGWIGREDAFPSGDLAPTAHPNCKCELEWRKQE